MSASDSATAYTTENKTLVIPVVSTANLPQLAVDLLISSLGLKRVAIISELAEHLIPVVGAREGNEPGLTTPLELYGKSDGESSFYLIQQRSPVMHARRREFIEGLIQYIKDKKFSSVLFLSGLDLTNRPDAHMMTPLYHLSTSDSSAENSPISRLATITPPFLPPSTPNPFDADASASATAFRLPSSGLTVPILRAVHSDKSLPPSATLLQYALEGDNRDDAVLMATIVAQSLEIKEEFHWKQPKSWQNGLFGTPHDQTLFG